MDRPLNVHPNIWNLRNKQQQKQPQQNVVQLDEFTKLQNAIDMIVQGIYIFKKEYQNIDFNQYEQKQKIVMNEVNELIDKALIPYSIDIVKKIKNLNQEI